MTCVSYKNTIANKPDKISKAVDQILIHRSRYWRTLAIIARRDAMSAIYKHMMCQTWATPYALASLVITDASGTISSMNIAWEEFRTFFVARRTGRRERDNQSSSVVYQQYAISVTCRTDFRRITRRCSRSSKKINKVSKHPYWEVWDINVWILKKCHYRVRAFLFFFPSNIFYYNNVCIWY